MSETEPLGPRTGAAPGERSGFRMRLADLMIWVLGAGVGAVVCREARPWEWSGPAFDVDRVLGMLSVILAILCGVWVFRQAVVLNECWRAGGQRVSRLVLAWRLAVVALLLLYTALEAPLLRDDPDRSVSQTDYY